MVGSMCFLYVSETYSLFHLNRYIVFEMLANIFQSSSEFEKLDTYC